MPRRAVLRLPLISIVGALAAGGLLAVASPAVAAQPTCFGVPATIVGSAKGTAIHGTKGDDVIYAGNGDDRVYGEGGNDLICGGYGADTLYGGAGNDWLAGGPGKKVGHTRIVGDVLFDDAGDDFFSPGYDGRYPAKTPDRISFYYAPNAVTINTATHTATGNGSDSWLGDNAEIYGSRHDDTFIGGPANDRFMGGAGHDTMAGNGGDDVLKDDYPRKPDGEWDTLDGGAGNDQVYSEGGADRLTGGDGNDWIATYGHRGVRLDAGAGDDTVYQSLDATTDQSVVGGTGADQVHLFVDMRKDSWPRLVVHQDSGTAAWAGQTSGFPFSGVDDLDVHGFPLSFYGGSLDETVRSDGMWAFRAWGGPGNDIFFGAISSDQYDGGPGSDRVTTGGGNDVCTSIEVISGTCASG